MIKKKQTFRLPLAMDISLIREEWLQVLMIIFDFFQIMNEKATEYTGVECSLKQSPARF